LNKKKKILVYGYGNPGRQDDGLGILLAQELEKWAEEHKYAHYHFETNYQLNIEDAEIISNYDVVIFADASVEELEQGVVLTRLDGENEMAFTTHAASPGYVFHLCSTLFSKKPEAYLLHMKGYEWEFSEGLSPKASENLENGLLFMKGVLLYMSGSVEAGSLVLDSETQNLTFKTHN
jgi:hydrogenase maturation protease